jgi:putative DNA primase/helicase
MSERERPALPALPTVAQVPPELRPLRRWCGWRTVWDESKGKWRKPPHSPVTGERVGPVSKNAEHFVIFDEALEGVKRHGLDGVGFVFLKEDGLVGVDFDDCRQADGTVHPLVLTWLKWFPTYKEVSPSGTGVHVIGKGSLSRALNATPLDKDSGVTVEVYAWDRYFTFTGQALDL